MEEKSMRYLCYVLQNWSTVTVRVLPGVMYQVICTEKNTNANFEYRFHWFLDCSETYIHNHRYAFDTYCLEGEYIENVWEIIDDHSDTMTYQFPRTLGNKFDPSFRVPGALRVVKTNDHFPGNTLHVEPNQFHSISPITQQHNEVLTFVARKLCKTAAKKTYVLSSSDTIEAPTDEPQMATPEEREHVYDKLLDTYQRILLNQYFKLYYDL
ncbi:hypothetical protein I4U23_015377 [Adineta vaga]|nr:hypothetical protein I4U23_015377 [Adineta vaga]